MTTNSIALNRTLFLEDNLPVLRGLDSDSIDLIATDPPFNKGVPAFKGKTKAGQGVEFKDVWNWDEDVHVNWINDLRQRHPRLFNMIHYANESAGDDMGAFICWMAVRVLEMHRVLKDTGSMYLHCDSTASHYLKAMMDAIFGRKNFRNEIVWERNSGSAKGSQHDPKKWGANTDIILFYVKSPDVHVRPYRPMTEEEKLAKFPKRDSNGRQYAHRPLWRGPGMGSRPNLCYEWRGFTNPHASGWRLSKERMEEEYQKGNIVIRDDGKLERRQYAEDYRGVPLGNCWYDIPFVRGNEATGYPTQKPLALYKRIIKASSNPGDMVLDPFAGCATTCVAAEQLGRQWIGIDIREEAGDVIHERLENEVNGSMAWDAIVRTPTTAPERTDGGEPAAPELFLEPSKPKEKRISVPEAREALAKRDGLRCRGCGWEPPYLDFMHVDHKKPRKLKGKESLSNFALLCEPCNRKKSYKLTLRELQDERIADGRMEMDWWESEGKWE